MGVDKTTLALGYSAPPPTHFCGARLSLEFQVGFSSLTIPRMMCLWRNVAIPTQVLYEENHCALAPNRNVEHIKTLQIKGNRSDNGSIGRVITRTIMMPNKAEF